MEKELVEEPRFKRAKEKMDDFLSKTIEAEEKRRKAEGEERGEAAEAMEEEAGGGDRLSGQKRPLEEKESDERLDGEREGQRRRIDEGEDGGAHGRLDWAEAEDREEEQADNGPTMVDLVWMAGAVNDEEVKQAPFEDADQEFEEGEWDPELVQKGVEDEMQFMESIGMFRDASEAECWQETGAAPVTTRWVMAERTLDD